MSLSVSSIGASSYAPTKLPTPSAPTNESDNPLSSGYVAPNNGADESAPTTFTPAPTVAFQPPAELQAGSTSGTTTLEAANAAYSSHDDDHSAAGQVSALVLKMLA